MVLAGAAALLLLPAGDAAGIGPRTLGGGIRHDRPASEGGAQREYAPSTETAPAHSPEYQGAESAGGRHSPGYLRDDQPRHGEP